MSDHQKNSQVLLQLREKLREIDIKILDQVMARMAVAKQIGDVKKRDRLPFADPIREKENLEHNIQYAHNHLTASQVTELTNLLTQWSIHLQTQ